MTESFTPIPVGITPVAAWRAWNFRNGKLLSLGEQMEWLPKVPAHAVCQGMDAATMRVMVRQTLASLVGEPRSPVAAENYYSSPFRGRNGHGFKPHITEDPDKLRFTLEIDEPRVNEVPSEDCSCGIYAVNDRTHADSYLQNGGILGRVALWGKVIVGEQGYRAEYAYPQSFYVNDPYPVALEAFEVPILPRGNSERERSFAELLERLQARNVVSGETLAPPRRRRWGILRS